VWILTAGYKATGAISLAGEGLLAGIATGASFVATDTVRAIATSTVTTNQAGSTDGLQKSRIGRRRREIGGGIDSRRAHRSVEAASVTPGATASVDSRRARRGVG
jgi:hypothetical protein